MKSYVVDTNIFNKLVDGMLSLADLPSDGQFLATHVQIDELNNTRDSERRARLFLKFAEIAPALVPTESFALDISRLDLAKLSDGQLFQKLKNALDGLNSGKPNNTHDALIAEVSVVNGFTLLTSDYHLAEVAKKYQANVKYFAI
jgi:predicted nucleic acid-binding protein